jgi:hypothetical protein
MVPFFTKCLDLAIRETRVVTILRDRGELPAGSYVFHEFYCDDLSCDCRRVMIVITRAEDEEMRERLATISYGWESPAYYRKWSGEDDPEYNASLARPELAPLARFTAYSDRLLDLFKECLAEDPALRKRFARHYRQFRAAVRGPLRRPPDGGRRKRK